VGGRGRELNKTAAKKPGQHIAFAILTLPRKK
jgi:hypothetical protein